MLKQAFIHQESLISHVPEEPNEECEPGSGIYLELGKLPPATPLTEDGLAAILGKRCRESVKRAVDRGELPIPVKLFGKNTWTAGAIIRHLEARLDAEAKKYARLRPSG